MKGLNVKRLAAIGAGIALLGTALAPAVSAFSLDKSDIVNDAGSPVVDVVVGSKAKVSDAVWAGNIAAKIAQLAYKEEEVTPSVSLPEGLEGQEVTAEVTGVSVDLVVGGTTTYSEEYSKTYDNLTMDSTLGTTAELVAELSSSQLGSLANETENFRYKGTTYTQTIREYIGIEADARMDYTHVDVGDLVLLMDMPGDFNYRVHFSKGLPLDNSETGSSISDFQAGDTDRIPVIFFGQEYLLYDVDTTRSGGTIASVDKIKLVKSTGEKTYNIGDEITELEGDGEYAGKTMTVRVASVWSGSEATFELLDEEGNVVDSVTTSSEGIYLHELFTDSQGDYALKTPLYLKQVNFNAATGEGSVVIVKGAEMITLANNEQYPYSATDTDTTDDYWVAEFVTGTSSSPDVNVVTDIIIKNSVKLWKYSGDTEPVFASKTWALKDYNESANEAVFLAGESEDTLGYGYVKIVFEGFKGDQETTEIKLGDGYVEFTDTGDFEHKVPFYYQLSITSTQGTFTLDNQTFYYKVITDDTNFLIDDTSDILNGQAVMPIDGNLLTDQGLWTPTGTKQTKVVDINGITYTCTTYGAGPAFDFNCQADGYFQIATAQFSSAATSDYIGSSNINQRWYYEDNNTTPTASGRAYVPLTGSGTNNETFNYAFYVNETYGSFWLLLDSSTTFNVQYNKGLALGGTDTDEDMVYEASYYLPDDLEVGGDSTDNDFYVATFKIDEDEDSTYEGLVYIYTGDDKLLTLPNNNLSNYGADFNYAEGSQSWILRADTPSSYIAKAYSDFGALYDVSSGSYLEAVIPQDQRKLKITVVGQGAEVTVTGGTKFCDEEDCDYPALVPDQEQLVDSTSYKVTGVNYTFSVTPETITSSVEDGKVTITCPAGGITPDQITVESVTRMTPVKVGQLVYTDETAPVGKQHIIIGGWKANSLASGIVVPAGAELCDGTVLEEEAALEEVLQSAGDCVVAKLENGDIIVAGYTAADTVTAAQKLIEALDALLG